MTSGAEAMPLPDDVSGACETLREDLWAVATRISHTQVAADTAAGVPGWSGEAADAYIDSVQRLGEHARSFAETFAGPRNAILAWSEAVTHARSVTVPDFQARYDQAQTDYENAVNALNDEVRARITAGEDVSQAEIDMRAGSLKGTRDDTCNEIIREYNTAMDTLDGEAQTAANAFIGAASSLIGEGSKRTRNEIGATLFNDIPLVDGQAEWEYAQETAPRIAAALRDEDLTADDLRAIQDKYGALLENPFIANALMEELSADELNSFAVRASALGFEPGSPESELVSTVLSEVGTAMVLSTGGVNATGALAQQNEAFLAARDGLRGTQGSTMDQLVAKQIQEYKDSGRTVYDYADLCEDAPYGEHAGYSIFSQLAGLAAQTNPDLALGPQFYTSDNGPSMADDLVAWDHENSEGAYANRINAGVVMPGVLLTGYDASILDPVHSLALLSDTPDSLEGGAGSEALQAAEGERLDAMRRFLTRDTPFEVGDASMDMTRYLTGHRGQSNEFYGFQDGGEAFGDMISDASSPDPKADLTFPDPADYGGSSDPDYLEAERRYREASADDERRTQIAANFLFGYEDGLDADHDTWWFGDQDQDHGEDVFGHANSKLRSWAGTILAPHIEGIAGSLDEVAKHNGVVTGAGGRHFIAFDRVMSQRLLGKNGFFTDIGFDNPEISDNGTPDDKSDDFYIGGRAPATDNLLLAAQSAYRADLADAVQGIGGRSINNVTDGWSPLMESLFTAPENASQEAIEALNARNERWQGLIQAGIGAVPFGDILEGAIDNEATREVAGYFIEQAKSNGVAPVLDSLLTTDASNAAEKTTRETMVYDYMKDSLYQEISTHGDFTGASISLNERHQELDTWDQFLDTNGHVIPYDTMRPEQRTAFHNFISENGDSLRYSAASNYVETSVNNARQLHGDARIIHGD